MNNKMLLITLMSLLLFLGACSQQSAGENESGNNGGEDAVKIGSVLPLTGPAALYGEQSQRGAKLAAKMINENGGILDGKNVELVFADDQSDPQLGVSKYKELIEVEKVDAITGGVNSSVSMATKEVAKDKVINVVTVSKAPEIMDDRDPIRFRLNSTNTMDGEAFHTFMAQELKPDTVAVIAENTDYGQAEIEALEENWADGDSPEIVGIEYFELTETNFTNPLTKLKSLDADALYVVGAAIEINSAIFKQAHQLGYNDTMKLLAPGNINTKVVELAGKGSEGVISADLYQNTLGNEMNKTFVEEFEKEFNYKPEKMEVLGFESIWFVAHAMDEAGSVDDYEAIAKVVESKEWESPRGTVKFEDGQALGKVLPLEIKDGKIIPYE